jgi:putative hydrolase of the HAD superfamily
MGLTIRGQVTVLGHDLKSAHGKSRRRSSQSTWTSACNAHRWMPVTTLFLDVGGVLLTNGWDHHARRRAAKRFNLPWVELQDRHGLMFETHEEGKLTFDEYLGRLVFYRKRSFTRAQFRSFMLAQSKPYSGMIQLVTRLKLRYGLKIAVVSNESREVNAYRIRKFKLDGFVDCFISSCFVHIRKPDADIFRLALDIAQAPARQVVYIENTPMFVQIAEGLGIRSILHTDYKSTGEKLASFGLRNC